jgi:hypothetical protein
MRFDVLRPPAPAARVFDSGGSHAPVVGEAMKPNWLLAATLSAGADEDVGSVAAVDGESTRRACCTRSQTTQAGAR